MSGLKMKCVQLDLARQIESVEYVKNFIDMASACGYDSILLYLEDRVRTASYPYPAPGQAYSPEEIRALVAHAQEKKIDLIPCVATLGHAERFLAHKELKHLSEVQDGAKNRFGNSCSQGDVFCMNHEEFYPFMEKYLAEVAELFPSSYFHAGLDEFFNFNLCDRCRAVMKNLQDEEDAFLAHIIRINAYLNKLGKRMMMWSDMFEIYTTVMARIPSNVIMVDWQYQEDVRFYLGHLFEQGVEHRQQVNNALGLTAVAASADRDLSNVTSTIKYALRNNCFGYMMTSWEKTDVYLYRTYPIICYGGFLLSGKSDFEAWDSSMEYLFGTKDPLLSKAVRLICADFNIRHFEEVSATNIFSRNFPGIARNSAEQTSVIQSLLEMGRSSVKTPLGEKVWKDLWNSLEEKLVAADLKSAAWDLVDYGNADEEDYTGLDNGVKRFHALFESKMQDWTSFRSGVEDTVFAPRKETLFAGLDQTVAALKRPYYLVCRFMMPDQYAVNSVQIDVCCNGKWIVGAVPKKGYKNGQITHALYEWVFPLDLPCTPEKVRILNSGMGGRGICYIQILDRAGKCRYIPEGITEVAGSVEHAGFLLEDDGKFAYFNNQSTRYGYVDPRSAEVEHRVTLTLKKV